MYLNRLFFVMYESVKKLCVCVCVCVFVCVFSKSQSLNSKSNLRNGCTLALELPGVFLGTSVYHEMPSRFCQTNVSCGWITGCWSFMVVLRGLDKPGRFSAIFIRETTFVTYCAPLPTKPFCKGICSKRKTNAPSERIFFSF